MQSVSTLANPSFKERRRARWRIAVGALLLFIAGGFVVWRTFFSTYHLATVRQGILYRDGSRSSRELARAVKKTHALTVVSLVDDKELADPAKPQFVQEPAAVAQLGAHYQRIPVTLGGYPTSGDVQAFLRIVEDRSNQPVLLHCAQGVRRTAMFVAAYQMSVLGWDKARAEAAILSFGHSEQMVEEIEAFIEAYDPATRTVGPTPRRRKDEPLKSE